MNPLQNLAAPLSKGCYFVKRKGSPKKSQSGETKKLEDRNKYFKEIWSEMDRNIKDLAKKTYECVFDEVRSFISSCIPVPIENQVYVPTGVLELGINMPDHATVFGMLEKYLNEKDKYFTFVLESKKCTSFPNLVETLFCEIEQKQNKFSPVKKKFVSKESAVSETNPIILLLQDAETIPPRILEELILNCKHFMKTLPIVLIFGMSSGLVTLNSILTQKALCCLGVKTFPSINPMDYLTQIIEEVIISPEHPFKLGPRAFRIIVDSVLFHDFSLENLTYLLKFAMIDHYTHHKGSVLCCHEDEFSNRVKKLSHDDLSYIKMLPSFQRFVADHSEYSKLIENQAGLKKLIDELGTKHYHHQRITAVLLKLLNCFTNDLPRFPLGKKFRELYGFSLRKKITSNEAFSDAKRNLKMLSKDNLVQKLKSCLKIINEYEASKLLESEELMAGKEMLESSLTKLLNLTPADFERKLDHLSKNPDEKLLNRYELMEKMRSSIKFRRSNFDALRDEIIEEFLSCFDYICPPSDYPLHEIFYFDDEKLLKTTLMNVPRENVIEALNDPYSYLKCDCCKTDFKDEIRKGLPDISVVYKLYKDSGKLINVTDWLQQFKVLKQVEEKENVKTPRKKQKADKAKIEKDAELNLRFLLAASELQLLGFVKVTKRKTDHVIRLTFE